MKKKLPLELVKGFNPRYGDSIFFEYGTDGQTIVIFRDKDPKSDFYFAIKQISSASKVQVVMKPLNKTAVEPGTFWFTIPELNAHFELWVKIIEEYNSTETIFDDPILKGFQDEFAQYIEFVEADADIKPFPIEIILRLDEHLERIESKIESFAGAENATEATEIKAIAADLRQELTTRSKRHIFTRLVNLWAKVAKLGPKYIKEFMSEGGKMIVKETIKYLIGKGFDALN